MFKIVLFSVECLVISETSISLPPKLREHYGRWRRKNVRDGGWIRVQSIIVFQEWCNGCTLELQEIVICCKVKSQTFDLPNGDLGARCCGESLLKQRGRERS